VLVWLEHWEHQNGTTKICGNRRAWKGRKRRKIRHIAKRAQPEPESENNRPGKFAPPADTKKKAERTPAWQWASNVEAGHERASQKHAASQSVRNNMISKQKRQMRRLRVALLTLSRYPVELI
jgi:hypothetical protein